MTVSNTTPTVSYTYGGPGRYDYLFLNYEETDLEVYILDDDSVQTDLVKDSDYVVTLASDYQGGYITVSTPAASGGTLIINRVLPLTQEVDWVNNDPLNAETIERSFDRSIMILQEQDVTITNNISDSIIYKNLSIQYAVGDNPLGTPNEPAEGSSKFWAANASTQAGDKVAQTAITGSAVIPFGTTSERDATPIDGYYRFNSTLKQFEGYVDGTWIPASVAINDTAFFENDIVITGDRILAAGKNAMSAGPITVDTGVTITIPTGSTWTVV